MNRVRVVTEDEINLIGIGYFGEKNKDWNLIFPGVDGNFFTNEFINILGKKIVENGYNFVCCHNRGSFQIINSHSLSENGKSKTIGSIFEKFEDCIYDIDSWIKYAINNNAKKINLIAHSHGCNKLIYYLANNKKYGKYINKIILLSPLDLTTRMNNRREIKDLMNKANSLINTYDNGNFICCGFFYKTANGFLDMITNKNIDNFPMMSNKNNNFDMINSIKKDKYIIYGGKEKKYSNNFEEKIKYLDRSSLKLLTTIENANHIYQNKEESLANMIIDIISKN